MFQVENSVGVPHLLDSPGRLQSFNSRKQDPGLRIMLVAEPSLLEDLNCGNAPSEGREGFRECTLRIKYSTQVALLAHIAL